MNIPEIHREENKKWRYQLKRENWSRVPEWNRPSAKQEPSEVENSAGEDFQNLLQTVATAKLHNA